MTTTADAAAFIASRGGVAYVWPNISRCCHGAMTTLEISTSRPENEAAYETVETDDLEVRYLGRITPENAPHDMLIELRGRRRPHLIALWDGCVYKA